MIDLRANAQAGNFTTESFSLAQQITAGASGALISLVAPAGRKVRLDSFSTVAGQIEGGVTITVDGSDIVTNSTVGFTGVGS